MLVDTLQSLPTALYPAMCEHQGEIEAYFGDACYRPLTAVEVKKLEALSLVVVAFTNRSGSTLLTSLLNQAGVGVPPRAEVFNSDSVTLVAKAHDIPSFTDYFLDVTLGWARDDVVAFKLGPRQLFWLTKVGLLSAMADVRLVNVVREDVIAQAVSLYLARVTGQWHSDMNAAVEASTIPYSHTGILDALQTISVDQYLIRYYSDLHGLHSRTVSYESLVQSPETTTRDVLHSLEIEVSPSNIIDVAAVAVRQQATDHNRQLVEKFRTEFMLRTY